MEQNPVVKLYGTELDPIPRRIGDVENPRGGIRHLIDGKGFY